MSTLGEIVIGILGGGSLVTLIIFLIQRKDTRKDELKKVADELKACNERMDKMERDIVRTQLLILMGNYTYKDESELLTVAEHYFSYLKGDWYMTSMFSRFIKDWQIECPQWFREG